MDALSGPSFAADKKQGPGGVAAAVLHAAHETAGAFTSLERSIRHSRSFIDVQAVDAGHALAPPPLKKIRTSAISQTLLNGQLKAVQEDENEVAEVVIVCEPEGATLTMGGLHPRGSLYERPVNIDSAKQQHAAFREVLRDHGVRVLTVREILAFGVEERMGARVELEELAADTLTYRLADGHKEEDLAAADKHYLSEVYKREVVGAMSTSQLIEICLINPTVTLMPSFRDTGLTASYTFEPLSNLVYTRDQQITTCRGIVMGRLRSQQRQKEVELMEYCFKKLGLPIAGKIAAPGFLEGGDFFPMGQDLALVGVGLRSNVEACQQLMDQDLLGTRRLGVVRDDFDRDQDRMHLDCVFSVLGEQCCIMLETIIGTDSPKRRLVDEYVRDAATGKYSLAREGVEFAAFIRGEGFSIIPIKHDHQLAYACNVLNLGKGRIISVHAPSAREIVKHDAFKGDVQVIDFSSVTSMYGSVHCASQVVRRTPAPGCAVPEASLRPATPPAERAPAPAPLTGGSAASAVRIGPGEVAACELGDDDELLALIAAVWAEALGLGSAAAAHLLPSDDFFALGGNPLLCGRMHARLRDALGRPGLPGGLIYTATTLGAFAEAVAAAAAAPAPTPAPALELPPAERATHGGDGAAKLLGCADAAGPQPRPKLLAAKTSGLGPLITFARVSPSASASAKAGLFGSSASLARSASSASSSLIGVGRTDSLAVFTQTDSSVRSGAALGASYSSLDAAAAAPHELAFTCRPGAGAAAEAAEAAEAAAAAAAKRPSAWRALKRMLSGKRAAAQLVRVAV